MILQLRHRCPHCHNVADFVISQVSEVVQRTVDPKQYTWSQYEVVLRRQQTIERSDGREACGLSRCPLCEGPLLVVFEAPQKHLQDALQAQANKSPERRLVVGQGARIIATYPEATSPKPHPDWPQKIQSAFVDLQVMAEEGRHPGFIISGCRTVLDVATKELGATQKTLYERIDRLASANVITGGLRDWAQAIRVDGNAAVHSLEGSREDASQFVEFIKLFLHVAFELPADIAVRKALAGATSDVEAPA